MLCLTRAVDIPPQDCIHFLESGGVSMLVSNDFGWGTRFVFIPHNVLPYKIQELIITVYINYNKAIDYKDEHCCGK